MLTPPGHLSCAKPCSKLFTFLNPFNYHKNEDGVIFSLILRRETKHENVKSWPKVPAPKWQKGFEPKESDPVYILEHDSFLAEGKTNDYFIVESKVQNNTVSQRQYVPNVFFNNNVCCTQLNSWNNIVLGSWKQPF